MATGFTDSHRSPSAIAIGQSGSTTAAMAAQNHLERESEDMSIMFSTSPEPISSISWSTDARHPQSSEWISSREDDIIMYKGYSTSTVAEIAAFSNHSRVIPLSALAVSDLDTSMSNLARSKPLSHDALATDLPHAEAVSPAPSTPSFDFSPVERTQAISFANRHSIQIASTSRRRAPLKSIDSTFSYSSSFTGITSPATSFDDNGSYSIATSPQDQSTSHVHEFVDKGKGKAAQVDDMVDSRPFASQAETTTLQLSFPHQLLMSSSPDGLGHYSPDVADLLPSFELERKAFDWDEFERTLTMSPGAGSSSMTPFTPVDSTALGLSLSAASPLVTPIETPATNGQHLDSIFFPTEQNAEDHTTEIIQNKTDQPADADKAIPTSSTGTVPRNRKTAVSMYEATAPDSNRRSVTYRTSMIAPSRSRANSNAPSILSRTQSASPSPRMKKKSLTLPSWLSKGKGSHSTGNTTPVDGPSPTEGGKDNIHKPRRLYKERNRAHTAPVPFPFIITPEAIVSTVQAAVVEDDVVVEPVEAQPVEEVSMFESMLHRELKLWVLAQLIVSHQEDFERRLAMKQWSVAHANHERWIGKDAGMRELIKLTRVSKSWQCLALDGQLWQTFDLKGFPGLSTSLVLKIAQCAGAFVQSLNLQGHHHLKPASILAISTSFSLPSSPFGHSVPMTQLTTINLVACTSITTHSLHYLLLRSPRLKHLLLRGLDSVTNTTLTEILGPHCHHIQTLDIQRCTNVNGNGLSTFAEQCIAWVKDHDAPYPLTVLKIAGMKGTKVEVLRKLGQAFPLLQVLDAAYCRDLKDDCLRAFVEWPTLSSESFSVVDNDNRDDWTRFSDGIQLTSREAGFDPGDPTKYWRRVTALRHLNFSGCRHITDVACSSLAHSVPQLEFLEMAGIGSSVHDDGLLRLFKTTPKIRKIDLEDATDITDAVLDCLIPEARTPTASSGHIAAKQVEDPQPGEMLEHLTISYAILITPEAMTRLVRGCKKLRVFEADNTRLTGSIMRDFVSRRRHREKGFLLRDGDGSEIVGIDCRAVSENSVKDLKPLTRPRRGWRGWEARDLEYEDGQSVGVLDLTTGLVGGPLVGQDECDEKRVVVKSFHSWVAVDNVAEQKAKMKSSRENGAAKNADAPRWLTTWSLGRRSPAQSTVGTPEEREDRGCIVQ